jgi:glycosyltransferase involved in cell wall biosynthesis
MIVRDEELYLEDCLKSVENIVDEIIIVDTGSKDNTKSIAEKFNSKLYNFKWVNDFSKARNESIKYASGKWILYLDADERLELQNKHSFIELLKNAPDDIGAINCIVESKTQKFNSSVELQKGVYPRIFRNYGYPKIRFEGIIHEQISNSLKELNKSVMISDIKILHLGYAKDLETLKSKAERNYRLLLEAIQKNPNDAYSFFQLGQTLIHLNNFEDAEFYIMKSLEIGKLSQALMSSAYNLLAQLKGRKRLYKEALEYAEKSIEIEYFQELAHSIKSEILIHTNRKEESKKVLKDLLNIKKNKPINQKTGFDISIPEHQIINVIENLTGEK